MSAKRGFRLGASPDLVLLHTDDVPSNYLALLSSLWTLRKVDHGTGESQAIAAVSAVDLQWNRTQLRVLP